MKKQTKSIFYIGTLLCIIILIVTLVNKIPRNATLPPLHIKGYPTSIESFISRYNYDDKSKYLSSYKKDKYSLSLDPGSKIYLGFSEIPHEYTVSEVNNNNLIEIDEDTYEVPSEKGSYTYQVIARWYDKGDITYKFTINIK